jgi:uncharacterized NAD-dependent epimerase/dehydratase family protein
MVLLVHIVKFMKKPILIDSSLTGGRDIAKQAYELITAFQEKGIDCRLISDKSFAAKLSDLGLRVDQIIANSAEIVVEEYEKLY